MPEATADALAPRTNRLLPRRVGGRFGKSRNRETLHDVKEMLLELQIKDAGVQPDPIS